MGNCLVVMQSVQLGDFYGADSFIDLLIVIVATLISYQSYKIFRLVKDRNYRFFSWAFLSIAIAFLFKIASNLTITYRSVIEHANVTVFVFRELENMALINFLGFMFYKAFLITGLLVLFLVKTKNRKLSNMVLFLYLGIVAIVFSVYFDEIFYLTETVILALLTMQFNEHYRETRAQSSLIVTVAFLMMLGGSLLGLVFSFHYLFYIISESFFLFGFLLLLFNHLHIKNEQKKK